MPCFCVEWLHNITIKCNLISNTNTKITKRISTRKTPMIKTSLLLPSSISHRRKTLPLLSKRPRKNNTTRMTSFSRSKKKGKSPLRIRRSTKTLLTEKR